MASNSRKSRKSINGGFIQRLIGYFPHRKTDEKQLQSKQKNEAQKIEKWMKILPSLKTAARKKTYKCKSIGVAKKKFVSKMEN